VVLAGRAFDAGLSAALPIMRGCDKGLALHMGKILECGSLVALPRESDGALGYLNDDSFVIEPADPQKRSTVELVAAHTLYEKSNPYQLQVPGGVLDLSHTQFTQEDERRVRVSGSRFLSKGSYYLKLEGAALSGYRTVCIAGTRDPTMIREIDQVIRKVRSKLTRDLGEAITPEDYSIRFRLYGRDGVMGPLEPCPVPDPQELGIVIDVVAGTQSVADTVCGLARSAMLHMGYDGRVATGGNLAFPYSPAEFAGPPAYEFRVYHLVRVTDPLGFFPIAWSMLGTQ
jgi:hypothetical protein